MNVYDWFKLFSLEKFPLFSKSINGFIKVDLVIGSSLIWKKGSLAEIPLAAIR